MKKIRWDEAKNKILKEERGVSFEEILDSTFLGAEKHSTRNNQMVYYMNTRNMSGLYLALLKINIFF